jgi:hypothetical protein
VYLEQIWLYLLLYAIHIKALD